MLIQKVRQFWNHQRWLTVLAVTLGFGMFLISIPALLIAVLIFGRILMILAGPVNVFNSTWIAPPASELIGDYTITELRVPNLPVKLQTSHSGFRLLADHRLEVYDLPGFGMDSVGCIYNGWGTWSTSESYGVRLDLHLLETFDPSGELPGCGMLT